MPLGCIQTLTKSWGTGGGALGHADADPGSGGGQELNLQNISSDSVHNFDSLNLSDRRNTTGQVPPPTHP